MEKAIDNVYDYSNIVPVIDKIGIIVQFFDGVFNRLMSISEEEKARNEKLKPEFQEHQYKNYYSNFEITIRKPIDNSLSHDYTTCKNFESFSNLYREGKINNISDMKIVMNLDFSRGKGYLNLTKFENQFVVDFQPYNIKFTRKSNYEDSEMDAIEKRIIELLNSFDTCNTIFCSK
jgi:hypothetical protein